MDNSCQKILKNTKCYSNISIFHFLVQVQQSNVEFLFFLFFLISSEEPYSSSKYATDMLSVALNQQLNNQVIFF